MMQRWIALEQVLRSHGGAGTQPAHRALAILWASPLCSGTSGTCTPSSQAHRWISTDQASEVPFSTGAAAAQTATTQPDASSSSTARQVSTATAAQAPRLLQQQQPRPARGQNKGVPPWTPSKHRPKQGFLPRRMGFLTQVTCWVTSIVQQPKLLGDISFTMCMLQVLEDELAAKAQAERQLPAFDAGDVLELQLVCWAILLLLVLRPAHQKGQD